MNENYICPHCGKNGSIVSINPLFDDVRYDIVTCGCGAAWRVYYKFLSPKTEVLNMPKDEDEEVVMEG